MKAISFLIPVYNKEATILRTLQTLIQSSVALNLDFEIIILDDASTDSSVMLVQDFAKDKPFIKVKKNQQNLGFAASYFAAAALATKSFCMYVSADDDADEQSLKEILKEIGVAPVILQFCKNIDSRPIIRKAFSKTYTRIINFITRNKINYYNGTNVFPVEFVKQRKHFENSFSFQAELVVHAVEAYDYIQIGTVCNFNDAESSAFKIKNILGVFRYLIKLCLEKQIG